LEYASYAQHSEAPATLVAVRQAAHAAHDTENVVVRRVDAHIRGGVAATRRADRSGGERQVEHRIVDTGEVARAAGLEVLGLQGEGVHVDALRGEAVWCW
jgi:hypothetical protein